MTPVFLVRRLGLLAAALFGVSLLIFVLLRLLPGDVATIVGGVQATPEQLAVLRERLGTDRPLPVQYAEWAGGVLTGDFGRSMLNGVSVTDELARKLVVTLPLTLTAAVLAVAIAVPLGAYAALRQRAPDGAAVSALGQLGVAVPTFWMGIMLSVVFAVQLRLLPAQGFPADGWAEPGRAAASLVLPVLTLALAQAAVLLRFVRSATLEVLQADFLRTARAKGLTTGAALLRHGLRNAAMPVVSVLGIQIASLIVGAVVVEQAFSLPGVGKMLLADVGNRDLVKVQGTVLLLSGLVLVLGTVIDIVHRLADPRLRDTP
ncbi:peptide ABC transporter [Microtetraspora sp. NBRC 13810]|uniref:ABC transporter permease n=1 Tax=Microtetraspora sp. NBRC 13810 TaxID=3030990 RepID=UPI0024A07C19|nr:ABC transporter permease [Microtetraspora sp. NBRC 13810]GLW10986.1 peptide ABC transporter [Microtetraspora sp. NBRC 13810]